MFGDARQHMYSDVIFPFSVFDIYPILRQLYHPSLNAQLLYRDKVVVYDQCRLQIHCLVGKLVAFEAIHQASFVMVAHFFGGLVNCAERY